MNVTKPPTPKGGKATIVATREWIADKGRLGLRMLDPGHRWRTLFVKGRDPFRIAEQDHFVGGLDPVRARRLFARSVSMVEIETSSYCNRVCWFCSNATYDRRSQKQFMDSSLYERILDELASIRYQQKISYSRYNEPLASPTILDRIREANRIIPGALLHLNTNGDFLDREYLDEIYAAGLRSMNIQVYLGNNAQYDHQRIKKQMFAKIAKLKLRHRVTKDVPGLRLESRLDYRDMALRIYGRNFAESGCNRGGTLWPLTGLTREDRLVYRRSTTCISTATAVCFPVAISVRISPTMPTRLSAS
uniref:Radical SAM superfamily protein n=1 Tax=Candidatus Kentrum sp. DK TaxID=2126562 RepID=A0A450RVV1_9GAMM|nr:MAG: Radical SAM superfamily protein [Candidatus Kentron sp. DK]